MPSSSISVERGKEGVFKRGVLGRLLQVTMHVARMPAAEKTRSTPAEEAGAERYHRDAIHKAHARWLCKRKRALSLTEDKEYHDLWNIAMRGAYTPPDHKIIMSNVLLLSGEGKKKLFDVNTSLRARGMKPAIMSSQPARCSIGSQVLSLSAHPTHFTLN